MMGLTPGPLVYALFLFALMNPLVVLETPLFTLAITLVVSVAWGLEFLSRQELFLLVFFFFGRVHAKKSGVQRQLTQRNIFAPKILNFPPSFKTVL